ncbi:MAG: hypothetical protein SCJ97_02755 [Bacillota bacterium]|nr:hypothetical protein [Bacillota bacterium]
MPLKNLIVIAASIIIGLLGLYLIVASGQVELDPFTIVLFLIVAGFIIYVYVNNLRRKN